MDPKEEDKKVTAPQTYTYEDLLKFESTEIYSGFGKMRVSTKQTSPIYGFGTADRNKQEKIFRSQQQSKADFMGKESQGPAYQVRGTDKFTYDKPPEWQIGTEPRNTLGTGAQYDYYSRPDQDFEPHQADKVRRWAPPTVRIGLESRFPNQAKRNKGTPGPQYDPALKPQIPTDPKFSFGYRREVAGFSPLILSTGTNNLVGPGSYIQQNVPQTSQIQELPHYSIPQGPRSNGFNSTWDQNQTYDTQSVSVGTQFNSKQQTYPAFSFGKAHRDKQTGTFKDMMATQPTKVSIPMPQV